MAAETLHVDPRTLRLPHGRFQGADPRKLQIEISQFGRALDGMPPIQVYRARDGELVISDGATRATRAAKLCPGELVQVEVLGRVKGRGAILPTVGDMLP